jgi:hypothetical protein
MDLQYCSADLQYCSSEIEFQSALEEQLFKSKIDERIVLTRTGLGCAPPLFSFSLETEKTLRTEKKSSEADTPYRMHRSFSFSLETGTM